ncbi:flavin reductase family protein [Nocardia jinanensis]|uniref:Oxidoreductase n=1 Tax=Nocardia jinanensis TaxID=382504 RepID=A0A917RDL2_9NOCA|nr:flavin reductase family protein [Nocardia jinanensis]GGL02392.1 putative oxidoreductase [Nocardia jinanensis]
MTAAAVPFDQVALRRAYGRFPSGVVALCAVVGGEYVGMAASSFVTVSLDPPLVAFCVQRTSTTWPRLRTGAQLGISVLGEDHQDAARALAAKDRDRFAGLATRSTEAGALFVEGASMWMEAVVTEEMPAGDHDIVLMAVSGFEIAGEIAPMVFHGSKFRRLVQESE